MVLWGITAAALGSKQSISRWGGLVSGGLGLLWSAVTRKYFEANMLMQTHSCVLIHS